MKEYAHQALLPDNLNLFIDKKAAVNFAKSYMNETYQSDGESDYIEESNTESQANSDSTYKSPKRIYEK
jgi:hypothetical protein